MAEGRAGALEDYATVAFSMSGVKQDISLEDWKSGWASIVGGLKGKPTSQQFNMVTYILSALLNQAISDLSTVKGTANSALPKSDFTAKQIVALLAAYGLMEGCDADTIDGKHANAFAPSTHEHSASQITSGNLPIERGGTGSGTAADACKNLGAMRNVGGTFTGTVYFANGTAHYIASTGDAHVKSLGVTEDVTARRVYDAVYNDYAEFMPRGENTEPGDIIALDTSSQTERYIKATICPIALLASTRMNTQCSSVATRLKRGRTSLRGTCPFSSLCPLLDVFMQRLSVRCIPAITSFFPALPELAALSVHARRIPQTRLLGMRAKAMIAPICA